MRSDFIRWADAAILTTNGRRVPPDEMVECGRAIVEAQKYFIERLEERRGEPGEDIISFIANATLETDDGKGRPLQPAEQLGLVFHFVVGGIETSANFLGLLLHDVLTRPALAEAVHTDPQRCPAVVEEGLRLHGPVQAMFRRATRDVVLGGVEISAGAKVLVHFGQANRDPAVFADPDVFDPQRDGLARHLSFGHGPHYCLGAPLARKEAELALTTLLRRIPSLRLPSGQPPELRTMAFFRGFERFELEYDEVLA
jgi:cytochrome P450